MKNSQCEENSDKVVAGVRESVNNDRITNNQEEVYRAAVERAARGTSDGDAVINK